MAVQQQASERRLRAVSTHLRLPLVALHPSASRACAAASFSAFADSSDLHPLFRERPNLMLVPIATPLKPDGQSLDEPALRRYVDHLYACGYEGLYVGGSSGEGYHMEEALRQELTVAAVEASRGTGKIVCVHVGASRQSEALRLATHAVAAGADAIASIPPYVGSPAPTFNETLEFYRQLAEIANGIPVICYNIPGLTGVALSVDQLVQLLQIPGVEGIKFSDDNLPALSQLAARCPDKVIFNGLDALLSFGLMYADINYHTAAQPIAHLCITFHLPCVCRRPTITG
jgi:dihydrodipicolinate synthase/N-acetylneuraminate lyase